MKKIRIQLLIILLFAGCSLSLMAQKKEISQVKQMIKKSNNLNQVADVAICQLSKHSPRNAGFPSP